MRKTYLSRKRRIEELEDSETLMHNILAKLEEKINLLANQQDKVFWLEYAKPEKWVLISSEDVRKDGMIY